MPCGTNGESTLPIRIALGRFFKEHANFTDGRPIEADPNLTLVWVEDASRRVCAAALRQQEGPRRARLWNVVTDKTLRRQGWARLLLTRAFANDRDQLYLYVLKGNEPARKMYMSLGFTNVGETIVNQKPAYDMRWIR
jgi:ribosomal protein S18 acetylase RimI-like enzyme